MVFARLLFQNGAGNCKKGYRSSVDLFYLKPCWQSVRMLQCSKCFITWLIFDVMQVREMGL